VSGRLRRGHVSWPRAYGYLDLGTLDRWLWGQCTVTVLLFIVLLFIVFFNFYCRSEAPLIYVSLCRVSANVPEYFADQVALIERQDKAETLPLRIATPGGGCTRSRLLI